MRLETPPAIEATYGHKEVDEYMVPDDDCTQTETAFVFSALQGYMWVKPVLHSSVQARAHKRVFRVNGVEQPAGMANADSAGDYVYEAGPLDLGQNCIEFHLAVDQDPVHPSFDPIYPPFELEIFRAHVWLLHPTAEDERQIQVANAAHAHLA